MFLPLVVILLGSSVDIHVTLRQEISDGTITYPVILQNI